jgi:hypothetical protein
MKKTSFSLFATAVFLLASCNTPPAQNTEAAAENPMATAEVAVTNPKFTLAPQEYAELAEQSLKTLATLDFAAWGATLADDAEYHFPDGDQNTRTKLVGRAAIVAWWQENKSATGMESMTLSEFNTVPLELTADGNAGASQGIYALTYFTNTLVYKQGATSVRMNMSLQFNADKKINKITAYYDRTPILKVVGKNQLEKSQAK